MYVVGDYILVEPFELKEKTLVRPDGKIPISLYGTVVCVGKGAEGSIDVGTIVQLAEEPGAHYSRRVGKRLFLLTLIQNIQICFDDMKEYKKACRDEAALKKSEESRQEPAEPKTKATKIITLPGSATPVN